MNNNLFNNSWIKKILLIGLIFITTISISIAGSLTHSIINPYGITSSEPATAQYPSGVSSTPTYTFIDTRYKDIHEKYEFPAEPFCKFGGQYRVNVINTPDVVAQQNLIREFYYCKTTKDLINKIRIPSNWANNNWVLYCNDGNLIYSGDNNIDFLTSKINTYKMCILKNLDLENNNTILYGFEVGNKLIDSNAVNFFNSSTKAGPLTIGLQYNETANTPNTYNYINSEDGRVYIFEYNPNNHFYSLKESGISSLNTPITLPDIGLSRVALFKKTNSNIIYGYETAIKFESANTQSEILPVYKILNLGINNQLCMKTLASYYPTTSFNIASTIVCNNNNIIINSKTLDAQKTTGHSLNLFINIILGTK